MNERDSEGSAAPAEINHGASEKALARRNRLVLGASAALCSLPVVSDLLLSPRDPPFRYFTSDTYYYLNVARNFAEKGFFSFDGEHRTNGFHPLWQVTLAILYKVCLLLHISELTFCYLVILVGVFFTTLAVLLLGRTIRALRGALPVSFALLPIGLYALLLSPVWFLTQEVVGNVSPAEGPLPLYGTTWSYANGMESSLALFAYALLGSAWTRVSRPSTGRALELGILGAFVVLARLDQVFIAASILGFLALRWIAAERWRSFRKVGAIAAGFALPIGIYLLLNFLSCGLAFPVSGASKFSFSHMAAANIHGLRSVFTVEIGSPYWLDRFFRMAQIVLPAAAAAGFLLMSFRVVRTDRGLRLESRFKDAFSSYMQATAVGVLTLCTTVFLFTRVPAYGSWSLPVPVFFLTLAPLSIVASRARPQRGFAIVLGAELCLGLAVFWTLHRQPEYHEAYRRFYLGRKAITNFYRERKPRIIEYDDGIIGFATHFPTLAAFNLATDKTLYEAINQNALLALARERGYDRIASLAYLPWGGALTGDSALKYLARIYANDPSARADYSLEYFDPSIPFAVARIRYWPESAKR